MDHPYENAILLPANCAVLSDDEMTYLEGGTDIPLLQIGDRVLVLDTDVAAQFCMNVVVNLGYAMTSTSFSYITGLLESGYKNGLSLKGTVYHTWGKLYTPWSRIAAVGITGLAGVYAGVQAVGFYRSVKSLFDSVISTVSDITGAQSAEAAA